MSEGFVSTAHLDYLQRVGIRPADLSDATPTTHAPAARRRLSVIRGVGRIEKRPPALPQQTRGREHDLRLPSEDVVISLYGFKIPIAFLVKGDQDRATVHLGTWSPDDNSPETLDRRQEVLHAALQSLYPSVEIAPSAGVVLDLPLAGLVLGVPTAKPPAFLDDALPIDRLIRALRDAGWAFLVLAQPIDETTTSEVRQSIVEELRRIGDVADAHQASAPLVEHYKKLLNASLESMTSGMALGLWRTGVYLLGDSSSFYRLAGLWRGIFSGDRSSPDPVRIWDVPGTETMVARWALPDAEGAPGPGFYQHPLAYQTLLTSSQLAAYVHLPRLESSGFRINMVPSFDAVPNHPRGNDTLDVGSVVVRGRVTKTSYSVALSDLTRHVVVTGVTGAGKTNTVFRLLEQATEADLPFLVVEPAKTEYRTLLNAPALGDRLHVFTPGNERISPIRLNPFEVQPGVPVGHHLDLLRSVFSTSFGMWTPLPQILEQCLHRIYEDRGWDIVAGTNRRLGDSTDTAAAFPTLSDLAGKIDEVTRQLGYEDRVTADMRAALLTRINGLRSGGKGRMLDVQRSLPMEVLLHHPTILELEGMGDDDDKAFVMGLLLVRLVEYRRVAGAHPRLRHLLVIEEAHRLLANVGTEGRQEEANPRGKAVEAFTHLLAEVRAYGQGILVADQVPVDLARGVIKNSNLKISHRTVSADDRQVLAGAMAMDERQARSLATLPRGQAVVFGEGDDAPILVEVALAKDDLAKEPPSDETIVRHMARSVVLSSNKDIAGPFAMCAHACDGAGWACDVACQIVQHRRFQRAFARLVLSAIEDPQALTRLWPDVDLIVRAIRPSRINEDMLLRCLRVHAAHWFAARRGAQAEWYYSETQVLAESLVRALIESPSKGAHGTAAHEFRERARQLHARQYDPFFACSRICRQDPPVCLYRGGAADLIAAGDLEGAWSAAAAKESAGDPDGTRLLWEVGMDAGSELIEFAEDEWAEEEREASDEAARRASLCFAQQMLARDPTKPPMRVKRVLGELLREAGHG